uniref:Homing endonuclease LAGLIDADG domain-containing protein n=1 Tax=Boodleopsis sp. FL1161 TaxID=2364084 RepID=A0A386AZ89_9CHLO|nr:hypothetical protein [Boodleopsis sp. FL1161]
MKKNIKLTNEEIAYIAGLLDGDSCLLAQLVRRKKSHSGFQLRLSLCFYQKTNRYWFLLWLKKKLQYGILKKKNGIFEYCIVNCIQVKKILQLVYNKLRIKHKLCKLILTIIENFQKVKTNHDLIQIAKKVDQIANWNGLKNSKKNVLIIEQFLNSP